MVLKPSMGACSPDPNEFHDEADPDKPNNVRKITCHKG